MSAPTFLGIGVALAVCLVVFKLLELRLPRHRRTPWRRPELGTDISYWFVSPFVSYYLVQTLELCAVLLFALAIYGGVEKGQIEAGFGPLSQLPHAVQALLMLIVADLVGYSIHRMMHRGRLWSFHAIHHSPTVLDWLSALRNHPVADLMGRLPVTLSLLLLGFAPAAAMWVGPVFAVFAIMLHANLDWDFGRLRRVIASPRFHRWHHTSEAEGRDKNFAAIFPAIDIMFGTYHMPRGRVPEHFGTETAVPHGLLAQLAYPFRARQHRAG